MKQPANTISKADLAAMTGNTPAKAKRDTQPLYRLSEKPCERPGCTRTIHSYPGAFHDYCSLECIALAEPEYFAATMRQWALEGNEARV